MQDLSNILNDILNGALIIPEEYEALLDNIKESEGGYLHYNSKETNITNGYGVYRTVHPNALVFKYIDAVASGITNTPSQDWRDKTLLSKIDSTIDKKVDRYLSYLFYNEYLKDAHLELFDKSNVTLMANLYTNSQRGAWKSIQEGLLDIQRDGILNIPITSLSTVDGAYGTKTRDALLLLKNIETETVLEKVLIMKVFKKSVLLAMKSFYIDITIANPDKFMKNLNGWDNRVEELEHN